MDYDNKNILFMGDSITALGTNKRGWIRYFNEIIKPEHFVNVAVPGATIEDKEGTVYDYKTLYERIRQMAFLNKGIKLNLNWDKDDEHKGSKTFCYEGGIKEYVAYLNKNENNLYEDIYLEIELNHIL